MIYIHIGFPVHLTKILSFEEILICWTSTGGHGKNTNNQKVKLLPENRVDIDTLKRNINYALEGKFFLCRSITPTHKMSSIVTVVDDPKGVDAVRLALYDYTQANSREELDQVFPVGRILAILNPWFKSSMDGGLSVRCDNPQEVVIVEPQSLSTLLGGKDWIGMPKTSFPTNDHDSNNNKDTEFLKLKNQSNQNFVQKKYSDAIRFYNQALKHCEGNLDVKSNRAAAYLNLGCYNKALEDTLAVFQADPFHVKAIYRHVKSLWGLNRYKEALEVLESKMSQDHQLKKIQELSELKVTSQRLLNQHTTGEYDMVTYLEGKKNNKFIDTAEYKGPVKIVKISGKGRGLVATENINPGQLLICSRPFALYKYKEGESSSHGIFNINFEDRSVNSPGHVEEVNMIVQKLNYEPELGKEFYKLFAGPELGSLKPNSEASLRVDKKRIDGIVTFNSFLHIENFEGLHFQGLEEEKNIPQNYSGTYILPSYINHSCSESNCSREILGGGFMFIRAIKQIKAGEEILISYTSPTNSFEERKNVFRSHAFTCSCNLCKVEMEEDKSVHNRREKILKELGELFEMDMKMNVGVVMKNISELESFRQNNSRLNFFLADEVFFGLVFVLFKLQQFQLSFELLEKIHAVTKDSVLATLAVQACVNMFARFVSQKDRQMVNKWAMILKHDLVVAYGSEKVMPFVAPMTLKILDDFGWNSFLN